MKLRITRHSAKLIACWLALCLFAATKGAAHHGWDEVTDEWIVLTGHVVAFQSKNPHSELTLRVESQEWLVELGEPWRNGRAGLQPGMFEPGAELTVQGFPSLQEDRRFKAVRVVISGRNYDLYPGRQF